MKNKLQLVTVDMVNQGSSIYFPIFVAPGVDDF